MRLRLYVPGILSILLGGGGDSFAQCTYPALSSGTALAAVASPTHASFNQTQRFWSAVAIRSAPAGDWNLAIYQSTDVAPACVSTLLGSSAGTSGVDLVVGDFNVGHDALGVHYAVPSRALGSGDAVLEWDDGANTLLVNAPLVERTTGSADVVEVWDVALSAGVTYTLHFAPVGASLKLLLFKSGAGAYWAGRSAALVEAATTSTFVAPSTGFYGLAVVNDDGAAGSYRLGVGRCDVPVMLTAGTAVTTNSAEKYYEFNQVSTFWTALGARGTADWNVEVHETATGGSWPVCFADLRASSSLATPAVDFVVGNFNAVFVGTYYARLFLEGGLGSGTGTFEWDDGTDILDVDAPAISGATGPTDVLAVWDVYLDEGTAYQFTLDPGGGAMKLFVFRPRPETGWAGRAGAAFGMDGSAVPGTYVAETSDWHGVVVTNESGGSGTYTLGVRSSLVAVDDPMLPTVSELQRIAPNPARGAMSFRFALHQSSAVAFDVVSVTGRIVAETSPREWAAGRWTYGWDGRDRSGERLGAGVYFVRMKVGGRVVSRQKVVRLD